MQATSSKCIGLSPCPNVARFTAMASKNKQALIQQSYEIVFFSFIVSSQTPIQLSSATKSWLEAQEGYHASSKVVHHLDQTVVVTALSTHFSKQM